MANGRKRLDVYLSQALGLKRKAIRPLLARNVIRVDGLPALGADHQVDDFSVVQVDGETLPHKTPQYWMLHKPVGVVSATRDDLHTTVMDLMPAEADPELHIAGRLDLNSSGLLLLTNDSRWSSRLSDPQFEVKKIYRVTVAKPLNEDYIAAFAEGFYFTYEGIHTRPASLRILSEYEAEITLTEGRYHQIKRMLGRFRNPVLALKRIQIGAIMLDEKLAPGEARPLAADELDWVN
ncbi:MAG: pseudouridine synthase [Hahellaceae bacterium]|nr:pseudouridine synthase [Hahellaceae bacterium]